MHFSLKKSPISSSSPTQTNMLHAWRMWVKWFLKKFWTKQTKIETFKYFHLSYSLSHYLSHLFCLSFVLSHYLSLILTHTLSHYLSFSDSHCLSLSHYLSLSTLTVDRNVCSALFWEPKQTIKSDGNDAIMKVVPPPIRRNHSAKD